MTEPGNRIGTWVRESPTSRWSLVGGDGKALATVRRDGRGGWEWRTRDYCGSVPTEDEARERAERFVSGECRTETSDGPGESSGNLSVTFTTTVLGYVPNPVSNIMGFWNGDLMKVVLTRDADVARSLVGRTAHVTVEVVDDGR